MKVTVYYPKVVVNTIEIDIPEKELKALKKKQKKGNEFGRIFRLVKEHCNDIPKTDIPDYLICRRFNDSKEIKFEIIEK